MVDIRHLQIGQTAQRHAVVENKSELVPVLIPRPNILEKIAPKMDQITRRKNATRRNVQVSCWDGLCCSKGGYSYAVYKHYQHQWIYPLIMLHLGGWSTIQPLKQP